MKTLYLYEPAMCCPSGLCGPSIDPELLRMSIVIKNLEKQSIQVNRYNLKSYPNEFITNAVINELINAQGLAALPATVIDGKIVKTGKYPTNDEIADWLDVPADSLGAASKSGKQLAKPARPGGSGLRGGSR